MRQKSIFRIFLSGPSDVERDIAVAKEHINISLKNRWQDIAFEAFDFRDLPSEIAGLEPQEIINSHINRREIDLYIGIMCANFGSPTGQFGSGTEEEFEICLAHFLDKGSPHICFLFRQTNTTLDRLTEDDIATWIDVKNFRDNRVGKQGLYKNYETKHDLQKQLDLILNEFVRIKISNEKFASLEGDSIDDPSHLAHPHLKNTFFSEWLDNPGQALSNGIKSNLSLDDIYVPPRLITDAAKQLPKDDIEQIAKPVNFIDEIGEQPPFAIYVGSEGAGKTTILKRLFKAALGTDHVPVFLNCEDVSSSKFHDILSLINVRFKEQYQDGKLKNYFDVPADKRVILLDNFDAIGINNKGKIKLAKDLRQQNKSVFITVDSDFYGSQFDFSLLKDADLTDFEVFEIQEFNRQQIRQVTTNWVRAGQEFDISESEEESTVENYVSILTDILGFNYVQKCPLVILIALLGISGGEEASEFRHPSFVRYYEFLLSRHIFSTFPERKIELAYAFLSFFAQKIHESDNDRIPGDMDVAIVQKFSAYRDLPKADIENVFSSAISGGVLSSSAEGYRFRHNYAYYYFLTKYWSERLPQAEVEKIVIRLSDNLHLKSSASILTFLAYQNHYEIIIDLLQKQLLQAFDSETEFDFQNQAASKLTRLIDGSPRFFLDKDQEEETKNRVIQAEEEREERLNEMEPTKGSKEDNAEDFALTFIVTIRKIEVAGQLLKCHAVSMDAETKYSIFENSVNLGLRLLNGAFSSLFHDPDDLISFLHANLKNEIDEEEIRQSVFMMAATILASHMILWSRYLGSSMLEITSNKVASNNSDSMAHRLVKLAIDLDVTDRLRDVDLTNALKSCRDNRIATVVLRMLVWRRLVMRPKDDRAERQRVCDTLDIRVEPRKRLLSSQAGR